MTFRDLQTTYVLAFADGLEVGVTATSMAAQIAVEEFDARLVRGKPVRGRHIARLARVFVRHVERWTVHTGEGRAVPVSVEAFLMLDRDEVVMPVLRQWVALVRQPPRAEDTTAAAEVEREDAAAVEMVAGIPVADIVDRLSVTSLTEPAADDVPILREPDAAELGALVN